MQFVNPLDQQRRPVILTNNKLRYAADSGEQITDSIRVHVSSRDSVFDGTNDSGTFRFRVPRNVSKVSSIELVDVEIPNTAQNVHAGNNRICFNEYGNMVTTLTPTTDGPFAIDGYFPLYLTEPAAQADAVTYTAETNTSHSQPIGGKAYYMPGSSDQATGDLYHGDYTGSEGKADFTSVVTTDVKRFFAEITPGLYTGAEYVAALQNAMNFGATDVSGNGAKPSNTYLVSLDALTGRVSIAAGTFTGVPGDADFGRSAYESVPFSVRAVSVPENIKVFGKAVRNPLGVAIDSATWATGASNQTQDSYNRVILNLQRGHGLIPGDDVKVGFATSTNSATVVYVHGESVHVLLHTDSPGLDNGKAMVDVVRLDVGRTAAMSSVAQIGINVGAYRTGLVQSVQTRNSSGADFELSKVRANCSSDYFSGIGSATELQVIGFGDGVVDAAFAAGTSHDCLTLSGSHVLGAGSFLSEGTSAVAIASAEETTERVPRLTVLATQSVVTGRMHVFETDDLTTNDGQNVGSSTVTGHGKLDLTHARRVVFVGLEVVGTGKIGTVFRTDNDSDPYFARVQMSTETDSIEFDSNCTMVGRYHFRAPTTITEMVLRLYDEAGEPFRSEGVATSVLLDFVQPVC